jgi:hypothetical protein
MRWTLWINKKLKKRIDQFAKKEEVSLVALAEEAFTDLLKKYEDHQGVDSKAPVPEWPSLRSEAF